MIRALVLSALLAGCATTATGPRDAAPVIESVGEMRAAALATKADEAEVFEVQLSATKRAVHATANKPTTEDSNAIEIAHKRPLL